MKLSKLSSPHTDIVTAAAMLSAVVYDAERIESQMRRRKSESVVSLKPAMREWRAQAMVAEMLRSANAEA